MGGEVYDELWSGVYHAVLHSISDCPGLKEDRLMAMFPVLTPMEMCHVIDTLLLDDVIVRRRGKQSQGRRENAEAMEGGNEPAAFTYYFPCARILL